MLVRIKQRLDNTKRGITKNKKKMQFADQTGAPNYTWKQYIEL